MKLLHFHLISYSQQWMKLSGESDAPATLLPQQEPPSLLDSLLGGPQCPPGYFGKGRLILALTEN
jgi:hypothetical protein